MSVVLDSESIKSLTQSLLDGFKQEGLVLVPEEYAAFTGEFNNERKKLLRKKHLSTHQIIKFKLLDGVKSIKTLKHMIGDGRIGKNEWFRDGKGNYRILIIAIKRMNNE